MSFHYSELSYFQSPVMLQPFAGLLSIQLPHTFRPLILKFQSICLVVLLYSLVRQHISKLHQDLRFKVIHVRIILEHVYLKLPFLV